HIQTTFFSPHLPPACPVLPLSLHDALPICNPCPEYQPLLQGPPNGPETLRLALDRLQQAYDSRVAGVWWDRPRQTLTVRMTGDRSEEHTSEHQSREKLVCRLLLEKKKKNK